MFWSHVHQLHAGFIYSKIGIRPFPLWLWFWKRQYRAIFGCLWTQTNKIILWKFSCKCNISLMLLYKCWKICEIFLNRISAQSSLLRVIRASLPSTEVQCGKNLKQLRTPCVHISTFDQTVEMGKGADSFPTSLLTNLLVPKNWSI